MYCPFEHTNKIVCGECGENYRRHATRITTQINSLLKRSEIITAESNKTMLDQFKAKELFEVIDSMNSTDHFDEDVFRRLVDKITIRNRFEVTFHFKIGIDKSTII